MLNGVMRSNESHLRSATRRILDTGERVVALLGLSFKPQTDDLRESPYVELAEFLGGKGLEVRIFDPIIQPARLFGSNRQYVEKHLPHLQRMLCSTPEEALRGAGVAVVATSDARRRSALFSTRRPAVVLDLHGSVEPGARGAPGLLRNRVVTHRERRADGRRVLIIVQNLSVPFDRRVWLEACSLRDAGFQVSVVCPMGADDEPLERPRRDPDPAVSAAAGRHEASRPTSTSSPTAGCGPRASSCARTAPRGSTSSRRATRPTRSGRSPCRSSSPARKFVFDQHDLCPEVYESRFPNGSRALLRGLRLLERATYAVADHVISTNDSYRDTAIRRGQRRARATSRSFGRARIPIAFAAAHPIPTGGAAVRYLCAYLGVMGPQDGVDLALRAAAELARAGRDDIQFVFMGKGDSTARARRARGAARDRGHGHVHRQGPGRGRVRGALDRRSRAVARIRSTR